MNRTRARSLGAALGLGLDRALGEPPAPWHPVARFGETMTRVERATYTDSRAAGVAYAAGGIAAGGIVGRALPVAAVVGLSVAGRELRLAAQRVLDALLAGDLDSARELVPALVGRDPSALGESGLAAAVIESLAENTVDAVVAPVFWAVLGGGAGAGAYRAVNTMDAMVGHRNPRYERYGWATARVDDVANFVPARLTAALVAAACPSRVRAIRECIRTHAPAHPSPNAGVAEAAFAAALRVELGGPLRYGDRHEDRPRLGSGPRPQPEDIVAAITLASRVELLLAGSLLVAAALSGRRR